MIWLELSEKSVLPSHTFDADVKAGNIQWLPYEVSPALVGPCTLKSKHAGMFSHFVIFFSGCCRRSHQSLQRYEKTENHMLVCTDCPQSPLVRNSRSQEHCARKCKKVKKNFSCRWVTVSFSVPVKPRTGFPHSSSSPGWTQYLHTFVVHHLFISRLLPVCFYRAFNFQRHNRKCHLLPFDRFTQGVQKQANVNFTLYEKKGTFHNFQRRSLLKLTLYTLLFFSREHLGTERDLHGQVVCWWLQVVLLASAPWFCFFLLTQ